MSGKVGSITTGIITDGLVLNMDAANRASYPKTGNETFNTIDTSFSGSLNGGITLIQPPISSSCWVLDGVDDYIFNEGIPAFNVSAGGSNKATTEFWIKINLTSGANIMMCAWRYYCIYCRNTGGGNLGFGTGHGDVYGISYSDITALGISNNWMHIVLFWNSDISYTNNKIYINGQLQTLSQQVPSEGAGYRNFNNGNFSLGCWNAAGTPNMFAPMEAQSIRMYNRELSASEVLHNYNALKDRFN